MVGGREGSIFFQSACFRPSDSFINELLAITSPPPRRRQNVGSNFYIIVLSVIFYLIKNNKLE